jgi:hypothetical protein
MPTIRFVRQPLAARTYMDAGAFGCLGVGASSAPRCGTRTTPRWHARSVPTASAWKRQTALRMRLRRALANAPAVLDVVPSQSAISSDAKKGLGDVPDDQPLTAWDDAERRRRRQRPYQGKPWSHFR